MTDPQADVEARLRQIRDEIDTLLDGGTAREIDGRSVGSLDDIDGVVFGLSGNDRADVGVIQEPSDTPPAPLIRILGEFIDGVAVGAGHPPEVVASRAIEMMEASKDSEQYERSGSHSTGRQR